MKKYVVLGKIRKYILKLLYNLKNTMKLYKRVSPAFALSNLSDYFSSTTYRM